MYIFKPSLEGHFQTHLRVPRPKVASPKIMNIDVIVIDDDAVVLFLHKVLIQKSPLPSNVKDFFDAREALEYVKQRQVDNPLLIFLDINMPGINGWEFLKRLEEIPLSDKIFVVMVTSSINFSDRKKADKFSNVIDFREKPLSKQACEEIYMRLLPLLKS